MKRSRPALAGLLGALLVAGCGSGGGGAVVGDGSLDLVTSTVTERARPTIADAKDVDKVADASLAFALDLYRRVAAQQQGENVVLGPFSTYLVLSMLSAGANGKTAEELAKVLHAPLPEDRLLPAINGLERTILHRSDDEQVLLRSNAQIWSRPGLPIVPAFLDAMVEHFGAPLATVDFADAERARQRINGWVKERTDGKIPELFPAGSLTPETAMVLVSAMYLDAPWEFKMSPSETRSGPFDKADGSTATVDYMAYDQYLPTSVKEGYAAVELPYEGGGLSMVVVIPRDTYKESGDKVTTIPAPSLDAFVKKLDAAALDTLLSDLKETGVHLTLPRFSFSTHDSLLDDLAALGAPTAMSPAGDFSRMSAGLHLAVLEHEAFIEVDERGTKAAAATGGAMEGSHGPTISADRPFLFLIRDRATNAVLFIGRVMDPSAH